MKSNIATHDYLQSDWDEVSAVSALVDGELPDHMVDSAIAAALEPQGRARWQIYHLIGDTMRSPDLLARPARESVLKGVRAAIGLETDQNDEFDFIDSGMPIDLFLPNIDQRSGAMSTKLDDQSALIGQDREVGSSKPSANDALFRWKMAACFACLMAAAAVGWNMWRISETGLPPAIERLAYGSSAVHPTVSAPSTGVSLPVGKAVAGIAVAASTNKQQLALNADSDNQSALLDPQIDSLIEAHRRMSAFNGGTSAFLRDATFAELPH